MNQNPIEDVLKELQFTEAQKEGFRNFPKYAQTCQESGDINEIKSRLKEIVAEIAIK